MDTPVKERHAANNNHPEESPFDFIHELSPVRPVKSQVATSLTFGSLPSVFTSPRVSSKHEQSLSSGRSYTQLEVPSENRRSRHTSCTTTSVGVAHLDEHMSTKQGIMECCSDRPYGQSSMGTSAMSAPIVPVPTAREDHEQFESPRVKNDVEPNPIPDGCDMFVFNSPDGAELPDLNPALLNSLMPMFMQNEVVDVGKAHLIAQMNPCQQHTLLDSSSLIERMDGVNTTRDLLNVKYPDDYVATSLEQDLHYKPTPEFYRGLRRCLEFEMAGAKKDCAYKTTSDLMQQAAVMYPLDDSSFRGTTPGIGWHLNAAKMNPNEHKHEHLSAETRCTNMRISPVSLKFPKCAYVPPHGPFTSNTSQEGVLLVEDDSLAYVGSNGKELNQCRLQRKRDKGENSGEMGACKRCNCKKSKCLKLYCECFAAGLFCTDPCACQHCLNKPMHRDAILEARKQIESRNPIAFAPKVIRDFNVLENNEVESSKTPASARHKKGCNCKRSSCLKKYCECYQSGVGCSFNCRCEGCKNSFGRKDVSASAVTNYVARSEEEYNKKGAKKDVHSMYPRTSSGLLSPFPQAAFTSMSKRPRSSSLVMPTALDQTNRLLGKLYFPGSWSKPEDHSFARSAEDEVPRILRNCTNTPSYNLKRSSPNSKRVSPPNKGGFGSSAEARGGRRMMLNSIPSFPLL